ncbi:MAG: hypothetical protein NVS2B4_05240 [Ramlibacter sp.]
MLPTTARLFGIRYQPVAGAKVRDPDVEVYDVCDGTRNLGRIYLDMHPRANKYKHYAHFRLFFRQAGRVPARACWCATSASPARAIPDCSNTAMHDLLP